MTNAQLVQVLARALRAAADELERGSKIEASKSKPKPPAEVPELTRRRARGVLERLRMG